jgi:hypothetical protein
MRIFGAALLFASTLLASAQLTTFQETPKQLFQNSRVTISRVDIPVHAPVSPKREHDALTVIVRGGAKSVAAPGMVEFRAAGQAGTAIAQTPLQAIAVEFTSPQGAVERKHPAPSRYCNPGSRTACVAEKYLLCTAKMCAEEVMMGAGAVTTKHSHDTDHMIIAVTDYALADDVVGNGVITRNVKSGEAEYIPAGITHTLTNKSGKEIRFVVVVFR